MIQYKDKQTHFYIQVIAAIAVIMLLFFGGLRLFERQNLSQASYSMMLNPQSGTIFGNQDIEVGLDTQIENPEYQILFQINNSNESVNDYQVPLVFNSNIHISRGQIDAECRNIQVTNAEREPMPFVVARGCNTEETLVWVKVPEVIHGINTIRLLFGFQDEQKQYQLQDVFIPNVITQTGAFLGSDSRLGRFTDAAEANIIRSEFDINSPNLNYVDTVFSNQINQRSYLRYRFLFSPNESNTFRFYTDSDDASELLVSASDGIIENDSEVLVSWYNAHNSRGRCEVVSQPITILQNEMIWYDYLVANHTGVSLANLCIQKEGEEPKTFAISDYQDQVFTRIYSPYISTESQQFGINGMYIVVGNQTIDSLVVNQSGNLEFVSPKLDLEFGNAQSGGIVPVFLYNIDTKKVITETVFVYRNVELLSLSPSHVSVTGGTRVRLIGDGLFKNVNQMIAKVSYSGERVFDYQVMMNVDTSELVQSGQLNDQCSNMMLLDQDGVTELPYIIVMGCGTENTELWAKVPILDESYSEIRIRYGDVQKREFRLDEVFIPNLIHHSTGSSSLNWRSIVSTQEANQIRANNDGVAGDYVQWINNAEGRDRFYRRYRFLFNPQVDGDYVFITNSGDASEVMTTIADNYSDGPNADRYADGTIVAHWYGNHNNNPLMCDGRGSTSIPQKFAANQPIWVDYVMHETTGTQLAQLCIKINGNEPELVNAFASPSTYYSRRYYARGAEPVITINQVHDSISYIMLGNEQITDFERIDDGTIDFIAPKFDGGEGFVRTLRFVTAEGFVSNSLELTYTEKSGQVVVSPEYIISNSCDNDIHIIDDDNIIQCSFGLEPSFEYIMPEGGIRIEFMNGDSGPSLGGSDCQLIQDISNTALICDATEHLLIPFDGNKPIQFITKGNIPEIIGNKQTIGSKSINSPMNLVFSAAEVQDTSTTICTTEFNVRTHDARFGSFGYGINLTSEDLIDSYSGNLIAMSGNLSGQVISVIDIYNGNLQTPDFNSEFYFEKQNQRINIMRTTNANSSGIYRIKMRLCVNIPPYTPQGNYVGAVEFSMV